MSDLKAMADRIYGDVMSGGNLDLLDEMFHDDFVTHEEMPGVPNDKEGPRVFISMLRAGFPDIQATIEEAIQEGETLAVRARMTGTHEGEFMGIPATGNKVDFTVFDMVRFSDGQAIEHWGLTDTMTMMQQLGVIPEEAPA